MAKTLEEQGPVILNKIKELLDTGEIKLIYLNRDQDCTVDIDYIKEVAEIKRFLEKWSADESFRQLVSRNPVLAAERMNLTLDPLELQSLWDPNVSPEELPPLSALRYRAFILEKITHRNKIRSGSETTDPRSKAWRERQMHRASNQLSPHIGSSIVHAPFCIELCHGCSVGCWFCGISAPKLDDIFYYTKENAGLFNDVLETLKEIFAEATGYGFCYWATDPLDNPDYENFMIDFHRITGIFPQTTTALALKDLKRTQRLLNLSREKGGMLDRFSLLSLKQLERVHQEFTAEELLYVELVTQNKEAIPVKSRAGRAMEKNKKMLQTNKTIPTGNQVSAGTIACVSGFLINMVNRTVKLISPCEADERWPLGYIVYDQGRFADGREFSELVNTFINKHMNLCVSERSVVCFQDYFDYGELNQGFELKSKYFRREFTSTPMFKKLGRVIHKGNMTVDEIVQSLARENHVFPYEVLHALNLIRSQGVLVERPTLS